MKDEIKDTIENQLNKTETNDETKSIETERKINDLIFEQNLKVMKKEELGELIIASEDMMYHVAKTLLYCDADCADAIQETIVKAFSKLHTLKSDVYAKTWLTRILINECYTVMRKEKKVVSLEDYQMEERAAETKDYSELYEAISRLSEDARLSVTLYYMEGYSVREIAGILGVTESAVKNRLSRARAKLKNELEQENSYGMES